MEDYDALLKRAKEKLPETISKHERFSVPTADIFLEGKTTVFRNFSEIASVINRDKDEILAYLLRELGTAGSFDGTRVIFKGRVAKDQIEKRIGEYVDDYVLCAECKRPDTRIVKEGRVMILECDACGAHRPITVRRIGKVEDTGFEAGKVYDVMIIDIGRKGDGVAKLDNYVIYVPGTAKGAQVKVKIEKVIGNIAYAKVVTE
jgi:translation initiation factor 2 subunit 2